MQFETATRKGPFSGSFAMLCVKNAEPIRTTFILTLSVPQTTLPLSQAQ
jgi:hypothetical protein